MAAMPHIHGTDAQHQPRGSLVLLAPSLSHPPTGSSVFWATCTQPSHCDFKQQPGNTSPKSPILELGKRRQGQCPAAGWQAIKGGGLSQCKGSLREKRGCSRSSHLLPEVHPEVLSAFFQPGPSSLEGLWIPWKDSEWGTWKDPNSQPGPECSKFNRKASHKPDQHENLPVSPSPVSVHELASVCKPYTNKSFQVDE